MRIVCDHGTSGVNSPTLTDNFTTSESLNVTEYGGVPTQAGYKALDMGDLTFSPI
jgi:hypothetical protein